VHKGLKHLREAGAAVIEAVVRYADFQAADEIFSVSPIVGIDQRILAPGAFYRRAREHY
jgi:branched-chain amino acid aminotransferase